MKLLFKLEEGKAFAFETTLATKSYVNFIKNAKQNGYEIIQLFLKLNTEALVIERVKTRVQEGGHNIPEFTIRRRFKNGLINLFQRYIPTVDKWILIDNSAKKFKFIAEGSSEILFIKDKLEWNELKEKYNGN
ncbi:MAG: hypothetical protein ACK5M1_12790 [Xanthomarina gelatinilytica]|uniref:hypothetical protein n=1 Tax=Xanthomarina gelatinilytica TaxID=1137281 RepID=UPI003A874FFA